MSNSFVTKHAHITGTHWETGRLIPDCKPRFADWKLGFSQFASKMQIRVDCGDD